jgi:hypothetical protein
MAMSLTSKRAVDPFEGRMKTKRRIDCHLRKKDERDGWNGISFLYP